ncbi:bifunctional phosphopantothenoylcysteine decarboxylase/phosphopantothenate--cysteine ligase CoaBC [Desulfoprunum benzoelyticum]|uniref:Coenzyme A biosynthesis bifunctional protein CoaBC n=1 Tax=Desulfoprunum benzoelyticum TaxID=1506996 RepID=A0A840V024_9BACT|nr:bifunctional phosphopantothenoylcysteine decarboxylase/phosphopantothenate--cysteine ligase CoaBC [Desulfoprunum benzoelyticum]MBB5346571.1 phosphopantothenoylcysteine decarboxylase/phosphopantothenate--cysteine ligase [Desulfoprunum benzoelyticum]MBM9528900.1 bifunctional phosphopantothenoylcysteine decarboxylase/phosphopantothenate--cysteine ligase CoaBC [Desulfoprunum benzoelyticum]
MRSSFAGKNIVLGVTGSIAAFKVAGWVSTMAKEEAQVSVIMTRSAREFVAPLTFAALSGNPVHGEMFDPARAERMDHIALGREADLVVVAPATADTIARLAGGQADDLLTTTVLAARAPVIVCPAMNSRMYLHPATQDNIARLKKFGYRVLTPPAGMMACREEGPGRLPEWEDVQEIFLRALTGQDLAGERVLITAGPTREPLDPARFLSNRSSGKMGYALARTAYRRGAEVHLISGPVALPCPPGVERVSVQTAREMHAAVFQLAEKASIIVKAAAVADFRPAVEEREKVKKDKAGLSLQLSRNPDILYELGRNRKEGQVLVGFAAESSNLQAEGRKKLATKNLDLIAVNNINSDTTGFECDTNQILLIDRERDVLLPMTGKEQTADMIWDRVVDLLGKRRDKSGGD